MMRLLIGFFFGMMLAGAVAQMKSNDRFFPDGAMVEPIDQFRPGSLIFMTAQRPDGKASVIKVDDEGHVICSEKKPTQVPSPFPIITGWTCMSLSPSGNEYRCMR